MRPELAEAIRAALPERRTPRLMADFAVRLARLGHARRISVTVAETDEAVQAACSFFAEREAGRVGATQTPSEAQQADPPESTLGGSTDAVIEGGAPIASVSVQEACNGPSGEARNPAQECPPRASRLCGFCRAAFTVNRRHAKGHAYCSAACRSKARHRRNRAAAGNPGLAPFIPPDTSVYLELAEPTDAPGLEAGA
jgi:hypothetical protein